MKAWGADGFDTDPDLGIRILELHIQLYTLKLRASLFLKKLDYKQSNLLGFISDKFVWFISAIVTEKKDKIV